jgi:hypothetical protein
MYQRASRQWQFIFLSVERKWLVLVETYWFRTGTAVIVVENEFSDCTTRQIPVRFLVNGDDSSMFLRIRQHYSYQRKRLGDRLTIRQALILNYSAFKNVSSPQ